MPRILTAVSPLSPTADRGAAKPVSFSWGDPTQRNPFIALVVGSLVLVWAYWMMFVDTAEYWSQPQYSHGWIVPLIALYLMWNRRPAPDAGAGDPVMRWMPPVLGGLAAIGGACFFVFGLPTLAGVVLALGCGAALAFTLWGQPFATPAGKADTATYYSQPEVLWGIVGAGCGLLLAGMFLPDVPVLRGEGVSLLGLLVLIIGLPVAGMTSDPLMKVSRAEVFAGTLVILASTVLWAFGAHYDMMPLARYCFVASMLGLFLMIGGMRLIKWAGPAAAFLAFMFPLPAKIENTVLLNLQKVAAAGSEIVFTTIGVRAIRQGAQITLLGVSEEIQMEVAEACSGLSMSTILIAMAVAMVLIIDRPWWDKMIVLLSALPIALISNVFRIVVTGLLWMTIDTMFTVNPEQIGAVREQVHNYAGLLLMMPFALGLLMLEFKILSSLTVPEESQLDQSTVVGRGGAPVR